MPDFPLSGVKAVKTGLEELGYTADRAQKIDNIQQFVEAGVVHVGPIEGTLQITADGQDFTLIDTRNIAKVNNVPHGLFGWLDASEFQALGATNPNAQMIVKWFVDGKLYVQSTFYPADFDVEQILYFLERRAIKYHLILIQLQGSGANAQSPINLPYSLTLAAGLLPLPP